MSYLKGGDDVYPNKIRVIEIGPSKGFQSLTEFIPTELKMSVIEGILDAGISQVEVAAFVSSKLSPQMSDSGAILKMAISKYSSARCRVLAKNITRAREAAAKGAELINFEISASHVHNKMNTNLTIQESFEMLRRFQQEYPSCTVHLSIPTSFNCPYLGQLSQDQAMKVVEEGAKAGITNITLCDTPGLAGPSEVGNLVMWLQQFPQIQFSMHFHDTHGLALANTLVAMQQGIDSFETSIGGLGKCPFTPGAVGNTATEDLLYMLDKMEIATGVDLEKYRNVLAIVKKHFSCRLTGRTVYTGSLVSEKKI